MSGKKIRDIHENPFDLLLINLGERLNPTFKALGLTPNLLTLASLLITLFAFYVHVRHNQPAIAAVLYLIGYAFDCFDGNFARKYGMTSNLGDLLDHGSDMIKFVLLVYILLFKTKINRRRRVIIAAVIILCVIFSLVHLGCQELNSNNTDNSGTLSLLTGMCLDKEHAKYTRFVGCGTAHVIYAFLLYMAPCCK